MSDKKEYEWRLVWSNKQDSAKLRAAYEYCKVYPLFENSKAKLINHEEYIELLEKEEIAPSQSYWGIEKGQIGLVALDNYSKYSKIWEDITTARGDFMAGWNACMKNK